MQAFVRETGVLAPLDRVDVDTDQIIPKQFLKRIERTGFGQFCFNDWRYLEDGSPNPDFELNNPAYQGAPILAYYHSTCGGRTAAVEEVWEAAPVPYLKSVSDEVPGVKGRGKTAHQAGSKAGQTGEREQPDIDVGAKGVLGNVVRHEAQEGAHRERREGDSERTTDESEQHALGEQLAANAAPRSTQGKARPDLPAARGSSGQEEAGDIQAGEPQQHVRGDEEHPERLRQAPPHG